ncbi:hypothetical protein MSAN_00138300 [Mycena sanguinolenta]|uniref:Uncharacterized protein n=1 Tax=Mycena sanguinolenta TaxID=230812 RepID=A0A8H7DLX6_9AGAR|nr:hypothetical protein MSAN_00138300 [Mycena sanguinolenta]
MPCGMLDALFALARPWLVRIGVVVLALDSHLRSSIQWTLHAAALTASMLFSFESLVIVSFITFLFLGGTLSLLILWPLLATEPDPYEDCESGLYYTDSRDRQWMSVVVPVILVERNGHRQLDGILAPTSPHRKSDRPHKGERH